MTSRDERIVEGDVAGLVSPDERLAEVKPNLSRSGAEAEVADGALGIRGFFACDPAGSELPARHRTNDYITASAAKNKPVSDRRRATRNVENDARNP